MCSRTQENIRSFPIAGVQSLGYQFSPIVVGLFASYTSESIPINMEDINLEAKKALVQIADRFGHTSAMLTREETLEAVAENEGAWVFNGSQMVQPAQLAETNWDTVDTVRIVPGLVGGL